MYEDRTYENIVDEMLDIADENVDTREGSIISDTVSAVAMEIAQVYADMGMVLDEGYADTQSYYYLIKRAAERGIMVKEGTEAVLKLSVEPITVNIPLGTELNIGEHNYSITANLGEGYYTAKCSDTGIDGNNTSDDVIPMEDIEGLENISVVEIVSPGTDDEDVEELRERYFSSFEEASFGGNVADYKEKTNSFASVKGCKVYRAWNGGGTVKCRILGEDYRKASEEVVNNIQNQMDPTKDGAGVGIAPIGHVVTIDTVSEIPINVECNLEYEQDYTWEDIKDTFASEVESYLLELRQEWEDSNGLIVRSGQIESMLLDIQGVIDVINIKINNSEGNCSIDVDSVPIGGEYIG